MQLSHSITAYMVSAADLGLVAICFATQVDLPASRSVLSLQPPGRAGWAGGFQSEFHSLDLCREWQGLEHWISSCRSEDGLPRLRVNIMCHETYLERAGEAQTWPGHLGPYP